MVDRTVYIYIDVEVKITLDGKGFEMLLEGFVWTTGTRENSIPALYVSLSARGRSFCAKVYECEALEWFTALHNIAVKSPWIMKVWFYYTGGPRRGQFTSSPEGGDIEPRIISPPPVFSWESCAPRLKFVRVRKRGVERGGRIEVKRGNRIWENPRGERRSRNDWITVQEKKKRKETSQDINYEEGV